jgi:hypothetical protein
MVEGVAKLEKPVMDNRATPADSPKQSKYGRLVNFLRTYIIRYPRRKLVPHNISSEHNLTNWISNRFTRLSSAISASTDAFGTHFIESRDYSVTRVRNDLRSSVSSCFVSGSKNVFVTTKSLSHRSSLRLTQMMFCTCPGILSCERTPR